MGLIKAALASAGGVLGDQWKEYFYCDALPETVLAVRGKKKVSSRSSNKGNDNVITNGSVIAVADGQCMLIVDQGKVAEICVRKPMSSSTTRKGTGVGVPYLLPKSSLVLI